MSQSVPSSTETGSLPRSGGRVGRQEAEAGAFDLLMQGLSVSVGQAALRQELPRLGRNGADPGENRAGNPSPDATSQAVRELGSRGPVRASVAAALERQTAASSAPAETVESPLAQGRPPGSETLVGSAPAEDRMISGGRGEANPSARASAMESSAPKDNAAAVTRAQPQTQTPPQTPTHPGTPTSPGHSTGSAPSAPVFNLMVGAAQASSVSATQKDGNAPGPVHGLSQSGSASRQGLRTKAQPATPHAPPEEERLTAQISRGFAAILRGKGGALTMRLQPEALGDLKIQMAMEPGRVEASFEVESEQARDLLTRSMDSLKAALEARGFEVDRLDVRVVDRHNGPAGESPPDMQPGPQAGTDSRGGAAGDQGEPGRDGAGARAAHGSAVIADSPGAEPPGWPWSGPEDEGGARLVSIRLDAVA